MALAARLRLSLHSSGLPASSSGRRLGSIPRAFKTEGLQAGTRDLILKEGASGGRAPIACWSPALSPTRPGPVPSKQGAASLAGLAVSDSPGQDGGC